MYGTLTFEGTAYFSRNEVVGERVFEPDGIYYQGGEGAGLFASCVSTDKPAVDFRGEAIFERNKGRVRLNTASERAPDVDKESASVD